MPIESPSGKPNARRYSEAEKERALRAVRQLRKELGADHGTIKWVADQLGIGTDSLRHLGTPGRDRRRGEAESDVGRGGTDP